MNIIDLSIGDWIFTIQLLAIFTYGPYIIYRLEKKYRPDPKDYCLGEEFGKQFNSITTTITTILYTVFCFLLIVLIGLITLYFTSNVGIFSCVLLTFNSILLGYFIVRHVRELK
jgi:hypothetical protein